MSRNSRKENLSLFEKAADFYDKRDYEKAITYYLKFQEDAIEGSKHMGLAHRYLAECYLSLIPPRFEAAEYSAKEYHQHVLGQGDFIELQRALFTIGTVYFEQATNPHTNFFSREGHAEKCRYYFEESQKYVPEDGAPELKAGMEVRRLRNLICLEAYFDNQESLESHLKNCQKIAQRYHQRSDLCFSYLTVIKYFIEKEDFVAANSYLRLVLEELRHLSSEKSYSSLNEEATWCKLRIFFADKAYNELFRVVKTVKRQSRNQFFKEEVRRFSKLSRKLQKVDHELELKGNDAKLWESRGDLLDSPLIKFKKRAVKSYNKALDLKPEDTRLLYTIGLINEELKQWKTAQEYYQKELNHPGALDKGSSALGALRCACYLRASPKQFIEALQHVEKHLTCEDHFKRFMNQLRNRISGAAINDAYMFEYFKAVFDQEEVRILPEDVEDESFSSDSESGLSDEGSDESSVNDVSDRKNRRRRFKVNEKGINSKLLK